MESTDLVQHCLNERRLRWLSARNQFRLKEKEVLPTDEALWMVTDRGAYRIKGDRLERLPAPELDVVAVKAIDGTVWVVTADRAFRVDGEKIKQYMP